MTHGPINVRFTIYVFTQLYYIKALEGPGVDGRIILRWLYRTWGVRSWTGSMWLRIGTGGWHL